MMLGAGNLQAVYGCCILNISVLIIYDICILFNNKVFIYQIVIRFIDRVYEKPANSQAKGLSPGQQKWNYDNNGDRKSVV